MTELVVEIHVPLTPSPDVEEGAYAFPWIDAVEEQLAELEEGGVLQVYDDGEELEGEYLFFITGADEPDLLEAAAAVAASPGVPGGCYALVTDSDAPEMGTGRRVELSA